MGWPWSALAPAHRARLGRIAGLSLRKGRGHKPKALLCPRPRRPLPAAKPGGRCDVIAQSALTCRTRRASLRRRSPTPALFVCPIPGSMPPSFPFPIPPPREPSPRARSRPKRPPANRRDGATARLRQSGHRPAQDRPPSLFERRPAIMAETWQRFERRPLNRSNCVHDR
jgi:hypothetical protein